MFPKRNNKRFFDYESSSNLVPKSVATTMSISPTVQSFTSSTSIITTTTTTTSVHSTSITVSLHLHLIFLNWTILFMTYDLG